MRTSKTLAYVVFASPDCFTFAIWARSTFHTLLLIGHRASSGSTDMRLDCRLHRCVKVLQQNPYDSPSISSDQCILMHHNIPWWSIMELTPDPMAQFRTAGWRSMAPAPMPSLEVHGPSLPWPAMTATIAMERSVQARSLSLDFDLGICCSGMLWISLKFAILCCSCLWQWNYMIHAGFQQRRRVPQIKLNDI